MKIEKFEDLDIWQEARKLSRLIFEITCKEPFCKDFRLRDQIRASSGSVMDNIAEGFERGGNKEFIQFLSFAKGSCGECRSQSCRALDYIYIQEDVFMDLKIRTTQLSMKISKLISYLKGTTMKGSKFKNPEP